jgi:hypothetical protein
MSYHVSFGVPERMEVGRYTNTTLFFLYSLINILTLVKVSVLYVVLCHGTKSAKTFRLKGNLVRLKAIPELPPQL